MVPTRPEAAPVPEFLALASHPVRWHLLAELATSDRHVGELTHLVGQPQALVSYHLGRLRAGGLVSSRRSSFDGRAAYYRAHLDRCGELLSATASALHPGLRPPGRAEHPERPVARRGARVKVLFVCTGNGTRSQIAEALLRDRAGDSVDVASAGTQPKPMHANTIKVLAEAGIDASEAESKHIALFTARRFEHVITLCDRAREICPEFPGQQRAIHWSIEDPSQQSATSRSTMPAFRAVAADLQQRIDFLIPLITTESNKEHIRHGR
jgi:ArsR family transcriptional regulator, arsenate/arsenite/antimonite-responsive transcriptional repressor / arsenate reductase (thioredoxin)